VLAVNKEENSFRKPIPYIEPPGVVRQQQLSNNNTVILQNEQAISLICNLLKNDSRGVFKTLNLDLRQYGRLQMFAHAESVNGPNDLVNDDLNAVIRIGNDFINNYYEIKIPLKITPWGASKDTEIWPEANNLDIDLNDLIQLKVRRNNLPAGDPRRI
jgi:cell surface protein SprA